MDFFTLVAVCHTVVPEISARECDEEITYQAASPDEGALVKVQLDCFTYVGHFNTNTSYLVRNHEMYK